MRVAVKLFAAARQLAGQEEAEVEIAAGATVAELRAAVAEKFPALGALLPHALFSINAEYAADSTPVPARGEIACIPPVSGG